MKESYEEQHEELATTKNIVQGVGVLADTLGLGLEYGLRYTGNCKPPYFDFHL
ncbi:hypothetical protein [Candidatus Paracaedibacter symbiosus]|uniref:hypothetical protein n=1 Tax=Candidatus Paracaedibacter symbiosus TaxID=244582 RepID=UPI0018DDA1F7|nr:hypothetical protein [Candidatus Paracaedibacter symbiosus]